MKIIQFMPYFPPHKGGLETVGEEIGKFWTIKNYGAFINVTFDIGQNIEQETNYIYNKGNIIGYEKNNYSVYLIPAFDLIHNFPFPMFWKKQFWTVLSRLKQEKADRVITSTRFFLSTLLGGFFAKIHKIQWVHIEYGSDYVKLGNRFFGFIAFLYDKILGILVFKFCNKIFAISNASKVFIKEKFIDKKIDVFYRGVDLPKIDTNKTSDNISLLFVGRLVSLKGVDLLLSSMSKLSNNICLNIIGDGDQKKVLQNLTKKLGLENRVKFLGYQNKDYIINFLVNNKIILVNPSYQEGMPTTVIEGLFYDNVVVASCVGGTSEISDKDDLILFEKGDIIGLTSSIEKAYLNYNTLSGVSKKYIENKFNWNNIILNLHNLLK